MSKADELFIANCKDILTNGVWDADYPVRPKWEDGTPAHTIKKFGVVNRYNLREEFPMITIRRQFLRNAVDELLWIWQKKSNNVHDLATHVWDAWADSSGSIGKAYGYQLGKTFRHHERTAFEIHSKDSYPSLTLGDDGWIYMDQVDAALYDLKHDKVSRRILTNIFNHAELADMRLQPCAYSMTFNVSGDTLNGILNQRSQDMLTANGWNVMQYAALLMMFADVTGLKPGELVHVIADAHIYDRHVPIVKEIIERKPYDAPEVTLRSCDSFYRFTPRHFVVEGYRYHDLDVSIPVAV